MSLYVYMCIGVHVSLCNGVYLCLLNVHACVRVCAYMCDYVYVSVSLCADTKTQKVKSRHTDNYKNKRIST